MSSSPGQGSIMQFGTSRFLQAHVDLFVSEAMARGAAAGPIAVVQTTESAQSRRRLEGFRTLRPYPVHIRGRADGAVVDRVVEVGSVADAWHADDDAVAVMERFVTATRFVVCNTGDAGWRPDPADGTTPRSFPARLAELLRARFEAGGEPLVLLPCELISQNGRVLRDIVLARAQDAAFADWLRDCVWANSLVDRIVSEALEPVGAVAEPYALWAIEAAPGVVAPCEHPDVRIVTDLLPYERLKLFILNLGHTVLAALWLDAKLAPDLTVAEAVADPALGAVMAEIYALEVLPVFAALGMAVEATAYRDTVLERFANPFLRHHLSDIAQNHNVKIERRIAPVLELARAHGLSPGARLTALLE